MYKRDLLQTLVGRLREPPRFLQVLSGPRQVGKTTLAQQAQSLLSSPSHYASADQTTLQGSSWIEEQWEIGRFQTRQGAKTGAAFLFLDEIHKMERWSEWVKKLWDEDRRHSTPLKVILLGSSPLLMQTGLTESLAGRFEIMQVPHWSYREMREAFGWSLEPFLFFGGYPGAAKLIHDEERWTRYILDSLVETTLSRDILLLKRIDKPALLRRLFQLGCDYSAQILSYQKMLGQLQEAGNTTTLAHYLDLLGGCGLVSGLPKFSGSRQRQRGSSPKLQVWNTALISASASLSYKEAQRDREFWGRLVESAVGAHLVNGSRGTRMEILYWRERNREVDFVVKHGKKITAVEVKSGRKRVGFPGMETFARLFPGPKMIAVGPGGIGLEEFLSSPITHWIE